MRRGKLHRETGEDGTVYVLLEGSEADGHNGPTTAEDGQATGNPTVGDGREAVEDGLLVESMQDQIEYLRGQLEEAHAANRENRRIIAGLIQRVPELEPGSLRDERGGTETDSEGKGRGDSQEPHEPLQRRSWLHRFFGFE